MATLLTALQPLLSTCQVISWLVFAAFTVIPFVTVTGYPFSVLVVGGEVLDWRETLLESVPVA